MNLKQFNDGTPQTKQWLKPVFGSVSAGESVYEHEDTPTVFPPAGSSKLYVKNDDKVYTIDSAGVERIVGDGTGDLTDLENKTQNIDLAGTFLNNTRLNGDLFMAGNILMKGTRDIIFGNGTQNSFISATTNAQDESRIRLQNSTKKPIFEICQPNAPENPAVACSVLSLNKNTNPLGGTGLSFHYNGTDVSVPNAGGRLNKLCISHTGSPCKFDFWEDNSFYAGKLRYNQGDKAGVGKNGLKILDTTPSTSTTTGAIQTLGGVGIAGDVNIGGNLSVPTINNNPVNTYGQWSQLGNLDVPLTATGTEFDLTGSGVGTLTVNTDEMIAGASWHVKLGGTLNTDDKDDITFKTYWIDPLGVQPDQLIFDSGAINLADTGGANQQWEYEFDYTIRANGANGTMYSNNQLIYSKAQTENSGRVASKWQNTTGLDMTYDQNWKFTVQWNTSLQPHTIINRMVRIQKVF